jgi:hypothetical protein
MPVSPTVATFAAKAGRVGMDLADPDDIEGILALHKSAYEQPDKLATPADFVWRHDQNPAGQAQVPILRNETNKIIGSIWIVPLRLRFKARNCLAASGMDLIIDSEHRNTFAYTKLLRHFQRVLRKQNYPLHFSFVSEEAYRTHRHRSPQTAWTVPLLVKPLNPSLLAETYWSNRWQRHFVKPVSRLASIFLARHKGWKTQEGITVRHIYRFDRVFDRFWHDLQDKYPLMLIRDRTFLTWRFNNTPLRQYRILVAEAGSKLLGYTVIRCAKIRGVDTGMVLDFLITDEALGAEAGMSLLAQAETFFREQQMAVSLGLMSSFSTEYSLLRQAGYIDLPPKLSPRPVRFALFIHDDTQPGLDSLSKRDWFITFADHEAF